MFYSICRLKLNSVYCRSRGTSSQTRTSNYFVHGSRETRMIFRSLKAKDPETGFASLASLETERKKSYGGRGGEYWSRMALFSFFLFLHELFFRPEQEYSFRATWRAFFFHNSFSFTNIHTHKVNKLSCLMVPPLLGSNEAAGEGGIPNLFSRLSFPMIWVEYTSVGANSLFLRIFFLFARSPKIWSCPGQRSSRSLLNWAEVSCWTDFMVVESNLPS